MTNTEVPIGAEGRHHTHQCTNHHTHTSVQTTSHTSVQTTTHTSVQTRKINQAEGGEEEAHTHIHARPVTDTHTPHPVHTQTTYYKYIFKKIEHENKY